LFHIRRHVHDAIIGEGIHHLIPVAPFDVFASLVLQGHFNQRIDRKLHEFLHYFGSPFRISSCRAMALHHPRAPSHFSESTQKVHRVRPEIFRPTHDVKSICSPGPTLSCGLDHLGYFSLRDDSVDEDEIVRVARCAAVTTLVILPAIVVTRLGAIAEIELDEADQVTAAGRHITPPPGPGDERVARVVANRRSDGSPG
jgi:hypothetical protein